MPSRVWIIGLLVLWVLANPAPSSPQSDVLPLGDGKISRGPQVGSLWPCRSQFYGGGAYRTGEWVYSNGTWEPAKKIPVQGQVAWTNHAFAISVSGATRTFKGNGLPDHATGTFPIQSNDPTFQYDRNPNYIRPQYYDFALPANPVLASSPSCLPMGPIGILTNGVVIFHALDAVGRDGVAHEIQDACAGHPEISGRYHYHCLSPCVPDDGSGHSNLIGYAFDGFGMFGYRGENGRELTNNSLDACHGHTHEIQWDGKKVSMYHYHMTREYPYTLGCYSGAYSVSYPSAGHSAQPPRPY